MNRKLYWGLGILILLVVGFVFYKQYADIQQLKQEAAEAQKLLEEKTKPIAENAKPAARPGFKMVQHDDHFHEVPIDAPDVWQETPVVQPVQANKTPTYTGPLTYHAELLKTNPVKALRLQAEERGHWSAKWIPPFPPDDLEAAEIARTQYLIIYYETIGDTDNPEYKKANRASWEEISRSMERSREIRAMGWTTKEARDAHGRSNDLLMLSFPRFPEADVPQFPFYEKGWRTQASNYFPVRIEDLKFPLQFSASK